GLPTTGIVSALKGGIRIFVKLISGIVFPQGAVPLNIRFPAFCLVFGVLALVPLVQPLRPAISTGTITPRFSSCHVISPLSHNFPRRWIRGPSGRNKTTAVDMDELSGHIRGVFRCEKHIRRRHLGRLSSTPIKVPEPKSEIASLGKLAGISGVQIGPGATALT